MKNIWMLTTANLRKNKGQAVSLLVFVLFAAMLLNIGLVLYSGVGQYFDERAEQLHAPHFSSIFYQAGSTGKELEFLESYPGINEIEEISVISGMGEYYFDDTQNICYPIFSKVHKNQKMDAPSFVGDTLPLTDDAIYIPYAIMLNGDFETGDNFKVNINRTELNFTIAGSTEEITFGSQLSSIYRFYISDARFDDLWQQFPDNHFTLLSARMENSRDNVFLQADYNKEVPLEGHLITHAYDLVRQARIMIPMIAAIMVTAFAIILLAVSLIVLRFRIVSSIEEGMTNIGTLKAVGHRNIQIILSFVLQFGLIALVGGVIGVTVSQRVIPMITKIMEPMLSLVWVPAFDIVPALISLIFILSAVLFITYLSARKINKLHPLIALRGGITTHNFRKNALPLDQAHGPLNFLLALKQLLQNKKQVLMVTVIVTILTFASIASLAIHYNMNINSDSFAKIIMGEMSDANFMLKNSKDGEDFEKMILKRSEVRKIFRYEFNSSRTILIDGTGIVPAVVEDCSLLEGNMLLEGRYPKHKNEIALGTLVTKVTGKGVGDTVKVKSGNNEKEYLITGKVQYINNNGFNGIMTGDALRKIEPDFEFVGFNVYLNNDVDAHAFIKDVERTAGDKIESVINNQDSMNTMLGSMSGIFAMVAVGIVAATIFIVILTLYMVIKTTIIRRRRELGIQKALGFTTFQLMNQIVLNLTPVILFGVVIGSFLGYFGFSPLVAILLSNMGIVKVDLPTPIDWTIITGIGLSLLAYGVSMLIAWRIRKISAYGLISE